MNLKRKNNLPARGRRQVIFVFEGAGRLCKGPVGLPPYDAKDTEW